MSAQDSKSKTEPKSDIWDELRKPFPKEVVGKLPKGGIQLDFVGHPPSLTGCSTLTLTGHGSR